MGKFLAGMLLALVVGFVAVPNAGAAEIPPTAKCVKTSKKLFRQYFEKLNKNDSVAATEKADRELAQALFDADCISAVEPVLKPMPPKPFSKKCVAAAKAAGSYWDPADAQFTKMSRRFERRLNPINRRINRLDRRIMKLRSRGASAKRIRSIARVRRTVTKRQTKISKALRKQVFRFFEGKTIPTVVSLYELFAIRCLDLEGDFFFEDKQKGPAAKVVHRNGGLIFGAVIYLALKYGGLDMEIDKGSDSASASTLMAPSLLPLKTPRGEPEIPLISR